MALSDELTKLAARARKAEERDAAATNEARAGLQDVMGPVSIPVQAATLQEAAESRRGETFARWAGTQTSCSDHVAGIRRNVGAKRAEVETKAAPANADIAEKDATSAVEFTLGCCRGGGYAVLSAHLARMDAYGPGREIGLTRRQLTLCSEAVWTPLSDPPSAGSREVMSRAHDPGLDPEPHLCRLTAPRVARHREESAVEIRAVARTGSIVSS